MSITRFVRFSGSFRHFPSVFKPFNAVKSIFLKLFKKSITLIIAAFLITFVVVGCNYDRASFLYNDIAPSKPNNLSLTNISASSATVLWTIADDQAYPAVTFTVYTILSNSTSSVTNLAISFTNSTNQATLTGLNSSTLYYTFVRSTNRAGHADSTNASFTTP